MLALASVDSSAAAAEFAALGVFFVLLGAIPTTIVVNLIVLKGSGATIEHFKRGMIAPAIFLVWAIIYQIGLWDRIF